MTAWLLVEEPGGVFGNEQYAQQVNDTILDVINAATTGERPS